MKPYGVPRDMIIEYDDPWDKRHSGHGDMKSHIKKQVRRNFKKSYRLAMKRDTQQRIMEELDT